MQVWARAFVLEGVGALGEAGRVVRDATREHARGASAGGVVPALGVPNLRNSVDSSQTRGPTPVPTRQSIHCVLLMDSALRIAIAERTV